MAQKILLVSRHAYMPKQKIALQKVHGKTVVIDQKSPRFKDEQELLEFHIAMKEVYEFIYYVLPEKFKDFLRGLGEAFGVLCKPLVKPSQVVVDIYHYIPCESKAVPRGSTFSRKSSKHYYNRNLWNR